MEREVGGAVALHVVHERAAGTVADRRVQGHADRRGPPRACVVYDRLDGLAQGRV